MNKTDITKVQDYMRRTFANTNIRLVARPKKDDSAEVYIGEEFIGVLFVDDEDDDAIENLSVIDTDGASEDGGSADGDA